VEAWPVPWIADLAWIDNSAAVPALRGIAIGRRDYLFASADSGGERAASHLLADRYRHAERA
jgi:hypothetical protein